ncbi:DUF4403 family protein [Poseidonocella sedimentorum]|uniref:DUF4403 family protein n=1 Tax=Poseidonocella sedimentorum TaxID=871652 RepID=A0A1I6EDB6_9RHOB|nr:DUF4403 family protein [Poseidonocella sedimentorum]SFR15695.1 protein of unknown function [Poseidonocella sedimentorum]
MSPARRIAVRLGIGAALLGGAAYGLAGVMLSINPDPPPGAAPEARAVEVAESRVFVPLDLPLALIENTVLDAVGAAPVAEGSSAGIVRKSVAGLLRLPGLGAPLEEECRPVRVVETITEKLNCGSILKEPKRFFEIIGQCSWRTLNKVVSVSRQVVHETLECTPLGDVAAAVTPVPELRYRVFLRGLSMRMVGPRVAVTARLDAHLALGIQGDLLGKALPLDRHGCTLPVTVRAEADVALSVAGRALRILPELGALDLALDRGGCAIPMLEHVDLRGLGDLLDASVGAALRDKMRAAFQGALDEQSAAPIAAEQVTAALDLADTLLRAPQRLHPDHPVWLRLRPVAFQASPEVGQGAAGPHMLRVSGGLRAAPELHYGGPGPDSAAQAPIPVRMVAAPKIGFRVTPVAHVPLDALEREGTRLVRAYLAEAAPSLRIRELGLRAYQSHDRIVLGLEAAGVSWLNLRARAYLTARPSLDPQTGEIALRDIKFDAGSSSELLNRAAWFTEGPLEHLLETRLRVAPDAQFRQILDSFRDYRFETEFGTLRLSLTELATEAFWIDDNTLKLAVRSSGDAMLSTGITRLAVE